jgi:hypothetical protein
MKRMVAVLSLAFAWCLLALPVSAAQGSCASTVEAPSLLQALDAPSLIADLTGVPAPAPRSCIGDCLVTARACFNACNPSNQGCMDVCDANREACLCGCGFCP